MFAINSHRQYVTGILGRLQPTDCAEYWRAAIACASMWNRIDKDAARSPYLMTPMVWCTGLFRS